jgi:hypothetical protein
MGIVRFPKSGHRFSTCGDSPLGVVPVQVKNLHPLWGSNPCTHRCPKKWPQVFNLRKWGVAARVAFTSLVPAGARRRRSPWPDACSRVHFDTPCETPFMTSAVRDLLRSFQSLSDAEKHEAASLLLRQVVQDEAGDVGDDALVAVAEELFLDLDVREAGDGQSSPR